ncbi:MAG: SGNH/GDSL hydrolase family protein [Gammaproteobacteria bacterium]|jgi:lysophospholipase L1-like esterase
MRFRNAALAMLLSVCAPAVAQNVWIGSWGAAPQPPTPAGAFFPASPSFENQTIRQIVRLSAGGERVRLRLTNEYGSQPLRVGAARVAVADGDSRIRRGTERVVTFSGATSVDIPAGSPMLSDPIDLAVGELELLSVSLYFPADTGACTCHQVGLQPASVTDGDATSGVFETQTQIAERAFLAGVDVSTDEAAGVVVALGDSITDGVGSTSGANRRWPDRLAERLAARSGAAFGVVNQGISGNRVLADGAGESALARFDRDVLAVAGATHVIVFEGINDLGIGFGSFGGPGAAGAMPASVAVTAETVIGAFRQIIARAHARGLLVYGATIAPYEGAAYYSVEGERVRQRINAWIRDGGEFDAVLDFDAVLRDPGNPSRIADGLHVGDFLHGSDAGYDAMAQSVDLSLFR